MESDNSPVFREPTLGDAPAISRLLRHCEPLDKNSHYLSLLLCHHFHETCVLVERDGECLGFISAYRPPTSSDVIFVWQVAVSGAARGQGLAGKMLDELVRRPVCRDVSHLEATISPSNRASQALFEAFARRHNASVETRVIFPEELFHGVESHEPEVLYRIGPLTPANASK